MEVADRLLQAAGDDNEKVRKLQTRFLKHSVEYLLWSDFRFVQDPGTIKGIYMDNCHQSDSYINKGELVEIKEH